STAQRAKMLAAMASAAAAAAALLCAAPGSARAAGLFWDANATAPADGGTGVWDNGITANWATDAAGTSYTAWNNANNDDATFAGTAGVVTVDSSSNVSAQSLLFSVTGYTLSGSGNVSLAGAGTIGVTAGTGTIANIISGSVGLTKLGAGTLVLTGANNYSGATTLSAGTIQLAAANTLPTGTSLSITTTGILSAGTIATSVSALSLNAGSITGTGSVLTSGLMSFTGAGPVNMAGTSQIGVPMSFSSAPTFDVATGGNGTINSTVTAPGQNFTKQGAGTLNMTIVATNSFSTVTVNSGTLAIVVDRNFGDALGSPTAHAVTLNGGAIRATSNSAWI